MINGTFTFGLSKVYRDVLTIVAKVHADIGCHQVLYQPKIKNLQEKCRCLQLTSWYVNHVNLKLKNQIHLL